MTALVLALAVAAASPWAGLGCGLSRPTACADTRQLVSSWGFEDEVRRFLGPRRAAYLDGPGLVSDQMLEVLGGEADRPARIGGRLRFTACRKDGCEEKGAVVLEPDGRLVALAIFHSDCGAPRPADDCSNRQTLTVFVRDRAERAVVADLTGWAKREADRWQAVSGLWRMRLDRVQVEVVR